MSKIIEFCEKKLPTDQLLPKTLPLIHTTEAAFFNSVLKTGILKESENNGVEILYFFYGRPAYSVAAKVKSRTDKYYFPVSLLVKPTTVEKAELVAIYPFDSGAFGKSETERSIHKIMTLESFHLGKSLTILPKLIAVFFGNNERYCRGKVKDGLEFDFGDELVVDAFYQIIRAQGESELDDRKYTIEIQAGKGICIQPFDIIAVALPYDVLETPFVTNKLLEWKATPLPYHTYNASKPTEFKTAIFNKVIDFYKENNYI
jgi:hypothetical protein